jgi:urease accessory protein
LPRDRRERLLEAVRGVLEAEPHGIDAGATCPNPQTLVLRAVSPLVEPLMALFQRVWATLRAEAWGLPSVAPRIWNV